MIGTEGGSKENNSGGASSASWTDLMSPGLLAFRVKLFFARMRRRQLSIEVLTIAFAIAVVVAICTTLLIYHLFFAVAAAAAHEPDVILIEV
jgi:hypothetical protein